MTRSLVLFGGLFVAGPLAADWPNWRGPFGNGSSDAKNLPSKFAADKVKWKAPLPGRSGATPAVVGDKIFLSAPQGADLLLMCLSATDGSVRWKIKVGSGNKQVGFNSKGNWASPSPFADSEHVWLLVGSGDFVCCKHDGSEVWRTNLVERYGKFTQDFAMGATPILWKDRIFVFCCHRRAESWLAALDKKSGAEIWKRDRPTSAQEESRDGYGSPIVFSHPDGKAELVVCGGDLASGHDPQTGAELWRHADLNLQRRREYRFVTTPVQADDLLILGACKGGPFYGVRPGMGDLTKTDRRIWTRTKMTPDVASVAVADGRAYLVHIQGTASCVDAKTGAELWSERIGSGSFFSSPIVADGKVFIANERGKLFVLKAGPTFEKISESDLGDDIFASPVPESGRLYLRTMKHLIRLEN
jgi:outer membrane protein assembly factor BamB